MIAGEQVSINGTGETSRDFCYIANVVQMNLLAASCGNSEAVNQVYNVAVNARTDLNELFEMFRSRLVGGCVHLADFKPVYQDFRAGDVLHSQADISKAAQLVGYEPTYSIEAGLDEALAWYVKSVKK